MPVIVLLKVLVVVTFWAFTSMAMAQIPPQTTTPGNSEAAELSQAEILDTVTVDSPIHFLTPQDADVVLSPGTYRVAEDEDNEMKFISVKDNTTILVSAFSGHHEATVATPIALYVRPDENISHILLLLPDGRAHEAVGSSDVTRSRSVRTFQLTPIQIQKALSKKLKKVPKQ